MLQWKQTNNSRPKRRIDEFNNKEQGKGFFHVMIKNFFLSWDDIWIQSDTWCTLQANGWN